MDTWSDITGRAVANIGAAPDLSGQSSSLQSETIAEPLKPTPGHKRAIAELALRFPAGREYDPDQYQLRLEYLAKDTAHIAVGLLRQACDRVAQTARGLPYASEILTAATAIVEERQRVNPQDRMTVNGDGEFVPPGDNVERCMEHNRQLARDGARYRVFPIGNQGMGCVPVEDDGAIVPTHVCTGDGMFRNRLGHKSGLWPA
jgi:hypothetical protein